MIARRRTVRLAACAGFFAVSMAAHGSFVSVVRYTVGAIVTVFQPLSIVLLNPTTPAGAPAFQGLAAGAAPSLRSLASGFLQQLQVITKGDGSQQLQIQGMAKSSAGLVEVVLRYKNSSDVNVSSMSLSFPLTTGATTFAFTVPAPFVNSSGVLFRLEAKDSLGQVVSTPTAPGQLVLARVSGFAQSTVGPAGGSLVIRDPYAADGQTVLDIPAGALDQDVPISIEELSGVTAGAPRAAAAPLRALAADTRFSAVPAASFRLEPAGLVFKKPVTLRMVYPDFDQDGRVDTDGSDERSLKIFAETPSGGWTLAGTSAVDPAANEVRTRVLTLTQFAAFPAGALPAASYRPSQKVFTPGRVDGYNDTLDFGALDPTDKVEILDSRGARIKALSWPFQWDGRDDSGRLVESGLYLYQYDKDGETVSGVFAVAK